MFTIGLTPDITFQIFNIGIETFKVGLNYDILHHSWFCQYWLWPTFQYCWLWVIPD